ncbi:MAG: hypothetical protein HC799_18875 [Limnothrix sp. RL_2_0]|nr:hypothetical protein [Limnothrix sp. RL_2_0]
MATQRPVLRRGSGIENKGDRDDVKYLQSFLKEAGFCPLRLRWTVCLA